MTRQTIGFIGGGNKARAIAGGLIRSGFDAANILISAPRAEQRALHETQFPGSLVSGDNRKVAATAGGPSMAIDRVSMVSPASPRISNTVSPHML